MNLEQITELLSNTRISAYENKTELGGGLRKTGRGPALTMGYQPYNLPTVNIRRKPGDLFIPGYSHKDRGTKKKRAYGRAYKKPLVLQVHKAAEKNHRDEIRDISARLRKRKRDSEEELKLQKERVESFLADEDSGLRKRQKIERKVKFTPTPKKSTKDPSVPPEGRRTVEVPRVPPQGRRTVEVSRVPPEGRRTVEVSKVPPEGRRTVEAPTGIFESDVDATPQRLDFGPTAPPAGRRTVEVPRIPLEGRRTIEAPAGIESVGDVDATPQRLDFGPTAPPEGRRTVEVPRVPFEGRRTIEAPTGIESVGDVDATPQRLDFGEDRGFSPRAKLLDPGDEKEGPGVPPPTMAAQVVSPEDAAQVVSPEDVAQPAPPVEATVLEEEPQGSYKERWDRDMDQLRAKYREEEASLAPFTPHQPVQRRISKVGADREHHISRRDISPVKLEIPDEPQIDAPPDDFGYAATKDRLDVAAKGRREFKQGLDSYEQRRRREDARLLLRKKGREDLLQKRRVAEAVPMEADTDRPSAIPAKVLQPLQCPKPRPWRKIFQHLLRPLQCPNPHPWRKIFQHLLRPLCFKPIRTRPPFYHSILRHLMLRPKEDGNSKKGLIRTNNGVDGRMLVYYYRNKQEKTYYKNLVLMQIDPVRFLQKYFRRNPVLFPHQHESLGWRLIDHAPHSVVVGQGGRGEPRNHEPRN